jgi:parallel beta-helix repeat protein
VQPELVVTNQEVFFDASLSYYPKEGIKEYNWYFDDGKYGSGKKISHKYSNEGIYNVTLTISTQGGADTFVKKIRVIKIQKGTIFVTSNNSIQKAINNSKPGYEIILENGTYFENIIIDKPYLSLIGNNSEDTIIDGRQKSHVIYVTAPMVNVTGFTIKKSADDHAGVKIGITDFILDSYGCNIKNNIIINNSFGINLSETEQNNIVNNTIIGNKLFGISLIRSYQYNVIKNNCISSNEVGIGFEYGSNWNIITLNTVIDNNLGVVLNWSHYNNIIYNNIHNNQIGIKLNYVLSPDINYNNIYSNRKYGLVSTGFINMCMAKHNWWGSILGPSIILPFRGDKVVFLNQTGEMQLICNRIFRFITCFPWELMSIK